MMSTKKVGAAVFVPSPAPPPPPQDIEDQQLHTTNTDNQDEGSDNKKNKDQNDVKEKQHQDYYDEEFHYSSKLIRSSRRSITTQRAYCWVRLLMLFATIVVIAIVVPLTISSRNKDDSSSSNNAFQGQGSYDPSTTTTSEDETTIILPSDDQENDGEAVTNGTMSNCLVEHPDLGTPPPVINYTTVSAFCPTTSDTPPLDMTFAFEQAVSGIVALHDNLPGVPEYLKDFEFESFNVPLQEGDFDVSLYFQVLEGLSLPAGKVLEYFYLLNWGAGLPVLYIRDTSTEEPFLTLEDYEEHNCEEGYPCLGGGQHYIDEIQLAGTPESYADLVTLEILGGQFYLYWYANFYDDKIIYKDELVDSALSLAGICACTDDGGWGGLSSGCLSSEDLDLLRETVDLTPTLECDNDEVRVSVVVYSNWGGFSRRFYTIDRHDGRIVHNAYESEEILLFQCAVVY